MTGRFSLLLLFLLPLAGCAAWPGGPPGSLAAATGHGAYHFGWRLSGNRAVAPLQVFDDGARTWLQFTAGQPIPAVFARSAQGDRLLAPTPVQGGFHVIDGVWPHLVVRGGQWQSHLQRLDPGAEAQVSPGSVTALGPMSPSAAVTSPVGVVAPVTSRQVAAQAQTQDHANGQPQSQSQSQSQALAPLPEVRRDLAADVKQSQAMLFVPGTAVTPPPAALPVVFRVSPADVTLRAALSRWAGEAGWTFTVEHWTVDVDIPIDGAAEFPLPFAQAVQALVGSTELSDYPLQPCFYRNQVLRIVPYARACGRATAGEGRAEGGGGAKGGGKAEGGA